MLTPGFHDVPQGMIASVATRFEMRQPAAPRPAPPLPGAEIRRIAPPDADWYRALFTKVGGRDWLWFARLTLSDADLMARLAPATTDLRVLTLGGREEGFFELAFDPDGTCALAYFGVTGPAIGTGAGRLLMNAALEAAWARPIRKLTVQTCTLDHPGAMAFYRRSGFVPVSRHVEIAPDPRLTGLLPEDAAPQVPILG